MAERPPPLGRRRGEAEGEEGRLVLVSLPKGELEARRLRDVLPRPHRPPSKSACQTRRTWQEVLTVHAVVAYFVPKTRKPQKVFKIYPLAQI